MRRSGANVDDLLQALGRVITTVEANARLAREGIAKHSFRPYHTFRDSVGEYEALTQVIEGRLSDLDPDKVRRVRHQLKIVRRRMLAVTIRAAFKFFYALSAIPNLPIGVAEVFLQELRSLDAARKELRSPEHDGQLAAELLQDLETAELILKEILERAPRLLDFSDRKVVVSAR